MLRGYSILNIPPTREALENVYSIFGDHSNEEDFKEFIGGQLSIRKKAKSPPPLWDIGLSQTWLWSWTLPDLRYEAMKKIEYKDFLVQFMSKPLERLYD